MWKMNYWVSRVEARRPVNQTSNYRRLHRDCGSEGREDGYT